MKVRSSRWVRWLCVAVGTLGLAFGVLAAYATWVIDRSYAGVPEPEIVADRSPEGVARGELLFQSICFECHGGADGRATGKALAEVPAFLGEFRSANLAHPQYGVHALSDGKIARVVRSGVLADGSLSVAMSGFSKIGDRDIAAILGYMRSRPPVFEPGGEVQPRTRLSLTGKVILTYVAKVDATATAPTKTVIVPTKAPSVEYGKYMTEVLDCVGCHTDGFGSDKMHDPNAFAGGFELTDEYGAKIWTKNITADEDTGIGRWSVADFEHAVTGGVTPDGRAVRKPMPRFSRLDHVDAEAIYAFLRSMPKVRRVNTIGGSPPNIGPKDSPEVLFAKLGCAGCHGDGAPHRDKIAAALEKSDEAVAAWILDPQATKPSSPMPPFKAMIDRDQATGLARYAKSLASARAGKASAL